MRYFKFFLLIFAGTLWLACSETASDSNGDTLELSESVENNAAVGFQVNQYIRSSSEVENYTNPGAPETGDDFSGFATLKEAQDARAKAIYLQHQAYKHLQNINGLTKVSADSLLFEYADTTGNRISRLAIYFDSETNLMRLISVTKHTGGMSRIEYDSLQVRIDVGNGLQDDSDDRLQDFYNYKDFRDDSLIDRIESELLVNAWAVDGEPTGFVLSSTSWYGEQSRLDRVEREFTFNPDESGSITETFYFKDGTSYTNTVTFSNDGTGSFSRQLRNGVTVDGSFNTVDDDLSGFYEATTSFPSSFYLSELFQRAEVSIEPFSENFVAELAERITFSNGLVDSGHVDISVSEDDGVRTTVMDISRSNGAHGSVTIVGTDDLSTLNGWWITFDDYYVVLTGEYYFDGSGWLRYEVYENEAAYDNGEDPILIAEYNFSADGSGSGKMTANGETYDVELKANGKGIIIGQTGRKTIELYRNK